MQYGTTSAYSNSYIKTVVEAWAADKVSNGLIEVKLISKEEIETELVEVDCCGGCGQCISSEERIKGDWGYNSNYIYWTMTPDYTDSTSRVMIVESNGKFSSCGVENGGCYSVAVRPVIVLSKSAL